MTATLRASMVAVAAALMLSGCDAIAGIFKAGMWTGVIIVIVVVAAIIFGITRMRK